MPEKSSIKRNILQVIEDQGITKYQFYALTGISRGVLDQPSGMSEDNIARFLAHFPQVQPEWLLTGIGDMYKPSKDDGKISSPSNVFHVKLVGQYAYAGFLGGYSDAEYMETLPTFPFLIPEGQTTRGSYLAFEVRGDSMDDGSTSSILEHDVLLGRLIAPHFYADSQLHIKKWSFIIVHEHEGIIVKKIKDHNVEQKTITIHSLNKMYPDKVLHLGDVRQIYNVVQLVRTNPSQQ